jgi:NADH-quinone oxidoreductase subunit J
MSTAAFIVIAILTLAGALAAASLPRLIHAALCLVVAFVGIAAFFFLLGAEFVGLVQVFVYVGAVAVLIVFTILLTRHADEETGGFNWSGIVITLAVFAGLIWAILQTPSLTTSPKPTDAFLWKLLQTESVAATAASPPALTVKRIGEVLMTDYVWPLQCVGLLLTAALIGGLILVMEEKR